CPRCSWRWRTRGRTRPTAGRVTAASTPIPSPGRRRTGRCRWRSIRRWCSSGCSGMAAPRRCARRAGSERRLQIAAKKSTEVPNVAVPYGVPESFHEHIQIQFDLLALAFQAVITRVAAVLYARDLTGRVYPESGTNISFHGGSHHAEDPGRIAQYARLNRYHIQMTAY